MKKKQQEEDRMNKQKQLRQILLMPPETSFNYYSRVLNNALRKGFGLISSIFEKIHEPQNDANTSENIENHLRVIKGKQFQFKFDEVDDKDLNDTNLEAQVKGQMKSISESQDNEPVQIIRLSNPSNNNSKQNSNSEDLSAIQNVEQPGQLKNNINSQTISLSQNQQNINNGIIPKKMVKNDQTRTSFLVKCCKMDLSEPFYDRFKVIKEAYRMRQIHKETNKKRLLSQTTFGYQKKDFYHNKLASNIQALSRFKEERKIQTSLKKRVHQDSQEHLYDVSKVKQTLNLFREKRAEQKRQELIRIQQQALRLQQQAQEKKRNAFLAQQQRKRQQAQKLARQAQQSAQKQRQEAFSYLEKNKQQSQKFNFHQISQKNHQQKNSSDKQSNSPLHSLQNIQNKQQNSSINAFLQPPLTLIKDNQNKSVSGKQSSFSEKKVQNLIQSNNDQQSIQAFPLDNKSQNKDNTNSQLKKQGKLQQNKEIDNSFSHHLSPKKITQKSIINQSVIQKQSNVNDQNILNSSSISSAQNPFMNSPNKGGPSLLELINNNSKSGFTFQSNSNQPSKENTNNIFTSNMSVNNLFMPTSNINSPEKKDNNNNINSFMTNQINPMVYTNFNNQPSHSFNSNYNSQINNQHQSPIFQNNLLSNPQHISGNITSNPSFFNHSSSPNFMSYNNTQNNTINNNVNLSSNLATNQSATTSFIIDTNPKPYPISNNLFLTPQSQNQPSLFANIPSSNTSYQTSNSRNKSKAPIRIT